MEISKIKELDENYFMNTFGKRLPVAFEDGKGIELISGEGERYFDFLGGIAVNALGHAHPKFVSALEKRVKKILHTSNYYYNEPQAQLAEKLCKLTCADKVFFANSGAEANEGAIKLAKIYFYKQKKDKFEVISLNHSFHGRTIATVSATGQEKYQAPYHPLVPGFIQVEPNSIEAIKKAITPHTACIMIELIQGEAGVYPMDIEYVKELRKICDEEDIILIFDEVQTGIGRCGKLFCHELYGVEPDIFTSAKALGGGVPVGAVLAKDFVAKAFEPGDHGSTFGGNYLAMSAGNAVLDIIYEENLLKNAEEMGKYFKAELSKLDFPEIKEIRGEGLLIGIEFSEDVAKKVYNGMFMDHYLTSLCKNTMRLAPALIITKEDIDNFINTLKKVMKGI